MSTSSPASPVPPASPAPLPTDWAVVAWMVAGGIIAALHVGKVPPALPPLRDALGLTLVEAGFVVSVFNTLAMLLGLVVGVMADRLGRRRLLFAGFACLAAGGVLGALSDGRDALLLSRFVEGVGFIGVIVASPALIIGAVRPADRSLALGLWSVFTPAGMALALVIAPAVLHVASWQALWLVVAGAAGVALIGTAWATRRVALPPGGARRNVLGTVAETVARPGLRWLSLAFGAYAFQWVSLMVWLPSFLAADLGATAPVAALLTALVVAVNVPSNILAGWLLGRGASRVGLIVGGSLIMGLSGWGIFSEALPDALRFGLCLVFSFAGGVVPASLFAATPLHAPSPSHMAAANGLLMQGSNSGQFIGPPIVAASVALAGGAWSGALLPLVGGAIVAAACGLLAGRAERRL